MGIGGLVILSNVLVCLDCLDWGSPFVVPGNARSEWFSKGEEGGASSFCSRDKVEG